jgi:hypothetical protein
MSSAVEAARKEVQRAEDAVKAATAVHEKAQEARAKLAQLEAEEAEAQRTKTEAANRAALADAEARESEAAAVVRSAVEALGAAVRDQRERRAVVVDARSRLSLPAINRDDIGAAVLAGLVAGGAIDARDTNVNVSVLRRLAETDADREAKRQQEEESRRASAELWWTQDGGSNPKHELKVLARKIGDYRRTLASGPSRSISQRLAEAEAESETLIARMRERGIEPETEE